MSMALVMIRSMLKRFLPRAFIEKIKGHLEVLDVWLVAVSSKTLLTALLYYIFFNRAYWREMHATLRGRAHFHYSNQENKLNTYFLRRNIHRLEKGLIMQPRRLVFGEGYIDKTLTQFENCLEHSALSESELLWASAVLNEYFSETGSSPVIDECEKRFLVLKQKCSVVAASMHSKPRPFKSLPRSSISFEDFRLLCNSRHSVRWFRPTRVGRELLEVAVDVALSAPSACNRQPLRFFIFDDPKKARKIGAIPMGTAGFSENFQCVIVIVGDLSAYPFEKDRHIIYIDGALASMQLQLALETLGLSSCSINWPDIERHESEMANELQLEKYERPIMLLAVGYADGDALVPYSDKKKSSHVRERPE